MGNEDKIVRLRDMLEKFREKYPTTKRYPSEFWREVHSLSKHHSASKLSTYLGIGHNNMLKRLAERRPSEKKTIQPKFIKVPEIVADSEQCRIRIEYPTGVKIQIF